MTKYFVAWNAEKTEGVLFRAQDRTERAEAARDADHAIGRRKRNPVSTLADAFYEVYGQDGDCTVQEIDL